MKETKKLYDLDAYATEFDANVLSCETVDREGEVLYQVVLDQTLFFPEEGGQTPDMGTIDNITVVDVQIVEGRVIHFLKDIVKVGTKVHGRIDWKHRFSNMQQHSGEHIFSGIVHEKFGYDNVGFHLSNQVVTMDFNGVLSVEEVAQVEYLANEVISRNIPIEVTFPAKLELEQLVYRSKIEIEGQVRIVTIPDVDVCACCAPHVSRTGEIGMLKVINVQNHRGGVRISILCGFRALEDYKKRVAVIADLSSLLSANLDTLSEAVMKVKEQNQLLKAENVGLRQAYMAAKVAGISAEQENVYLFEENLDAQDMRNVINGLVPKHAGYCGIFVGGEKEGYRFIIGSGEKDARSVLERLKEEFDVKGGGSAAMVQGTVFAEKEKIQNVLCV